MYQKNGNPIKNKIIVDEPTRVLNLWILIGILTFTLLYISYRYIQDTKTNDTNHKTLIESNIQYENQILNILREKEFEKSILKLEFLRLDKKISRKSIDSLRYNLYIANNKIRYRDSIYINEKYQQKDINRSYSNSIIPVE